MLNLRFPSLLCGVLSGVFSCGLVSTCIAAIQPATQTSHSATDKLQATCSPAQLQLIRSIKVSRKGDDAAMLFVGNSQTEKPRSVPISRDLAVRANVLPGDKICVNTAAIAVDRHLP